MSTVHIRPGGPEDAPTIVGFQQAMAHESEGLELAPEVVDTGVRSLMAMPDAGFYLVAEREGDLVGSLMVTPEWSDWRNGFFWWVQSVYVRPDARGEGVYRALHEEVKRLAASRDDVCGLRLYVDRTNESARRIYEHLGMTETAYRLYEESGS
jgi:GNAT superfamily N-acetyltransferase